MIIDAQDPALAEELTTPIVIVGAGAAGVTLALAFAEKGLECVLLEAGGKRLNRAAQDFYRAASIAPESHGPVHFYRRRALGGTTAIWGGRCIPFDPIDFEDRPWIPYAHWPVTYQEVARYYPKALEMCQAGPAKFQAGEALPGSGAALVDGALSPDIVLDRIERFSEPTHFGRRYGERLAASPKVTLVLNANVTQITVDANGMRASGVLVATLSGRRLKVIAGRVILASGALETTRLLLASNAVRPAGVGNAAGLVGRFYQSHLEGEVGEIQFDSKPESVRLDYERSPEGVYCRRYIWLSPDAQRREHLAGMVLRPHHPKVADPAHGDPVLSAMYLVKDLVVSEYGRGMNMPEQEAAASLKARRSTLYLRHLTNVVLGSPHLLTFAVDWVRRRTLVSRKLPSVVRRDRANRYVLDVNAEQIPNRDSQVRLSEERDSLGMPRLEIDWRITPQDQDNIARGMRVIQAAFARRNGAGGARVCLPEAKFARQISGLTRVGGHHIGTARMGRCPDEGVVDANCEAFDLPGLFVAGAAVLPTSGFANPMLVTLALTLRLADHIAGNRG